MRKIVYLTQFHRHVKRAQKRGKDIQKLSDVIELLRQDTPLPSHLRDHVLAGEFRGFRDVHIEPDWILIYQKKGDMLLLLAMTGTHSDLFK